MELEKKEHDFNEEEIEAIQKYIKNGKLGLSKIKDSDISQWFELYMSGKTYSEIKTISKCDKDILLFFAAKSKWYDKKMEYCNDIIENTKDKITRAKLDGVNTVSSILSALSIYYSKKVNKYISTKDDTIIEEMDSKMLTQYYKAMETIDKLVNTPPDKSGKTPTVNINVGSGASVEQLDDETIDITDDTAGDFLKFLSNKKKGGK